MCVKYYVLFLDEEDMETAEVEKNYQKIDEKEPVEEEMSNSVDEESDVSDKIQILRRGWLSVVIQ